MFYWLIDLSNTVPGLGAFRTFLNVFRYITFRTGGAMVTGALFDAAPAAIRGAWGRASSEIQDELIRGVRAGDVVMIKGSNGSRMAPIVSALREHFPAMRS